MRRLAARIYILCDGYDEVEGDEGGDDKVNDKKRKDGTKRGRVTKDVASRYREHLQQLRAKLDQPPFATPLSSCGNSGDSEQSQAVVEMVELPERHGSARAIKAAFDLGLVTTPFVMVAQHDNFFVSDVSLPSILEAMMDNEWIKCLHFISTATIDYAKKSKRRYSIDIEPFMRDDVNNLDGSLVPLLFWYGRTAISRTDYYTQFVLKGPTLRVGDHLEELLGVKQLRDIQKRGMAVAHPLWGNFVLDQGREVLYHLSGRRVRATADPSSENGGAGVGDGPDFISTEVRARDTLPGQAPTDEACKSFTTARSVRAIVPGLEIIPTKRKDNADDDLATPSGKFKQKCFQCGKKGHSYRFCPDTKEGDQPTIETIGL
eukprot:CAMPEP_0181041966 /NCGR_PEP_ID=MMETSP1070-20121207/11891_1 /TAXON_ID=265543 /ORGANISM="Minutocellus polymorphus, Strain NH13" /LENGTH=374 /DNA_ID=CAMNT_0023120133 /DNA_START=149 /DNA_END=1273 /DNA_ORIENTATION=-